MSFGIDANRFRPEHGASGVSDTTHRRVECAGTIQGLNPEIHGVHYKQVLIMEQYFGRKVELAVPGTLVPDRLQNTSIHIEHKNFVAQGISNVDPLRCGIDRNSSRPLKKAFATFQTADGSPEFPV